MWQVPRMRGALAHRNGPISTLQKGDDCWSGLIPIRCRQGYEGERVLPPMRPWLDEVDEIGLRQGFVGRSHVDHAIVDEDDRAIAGNRRCARAFRARIEDERIGHAVLS